jgi:hypothetical protein
MKRRREFVVLLDEDLDWPPELISSLVAGGYTILRVYRLADAALYLLDGRATALLIRAGRLGPEEKTMLRRWKRLSPRTTMVAVADLPAGLEIIASALANGATALLPWPAPDGVVGGILRLGRVGYG